MDYWSCLREITACVCVCDYLVTTPFQSAHQISFFDSHEAIFEVAPEPWRLVTLHLPVLDRTPTQVLVQLGDVDGCGPLLILRRGLSDPVVDVSRLARALILTYLVKNPQTMEDRPLHTSGEGMFQSHGVTSVEPTVLYSH